MRNYPTLFFQAVFLSLAMALSMVSCRNGKDPAASRGNLVVVGVEDETALLPDATNADFLFFSRLVAGNARGELEPFLASRWEDTLDGRTRTWHLRSDAYWHDGRRVTAHDVKFTFDLLSHPDVLVLVFQLGESSHEFLLPRAVNAFGPCYLGIVEG